MARNGKRERPVCAYTLADHLDAILAEGEDLFALSHALHRPVGAEAATEAVGERLSALRDFASRLQVAELSITVHLMQARVRAGELVREDRSFAPMASLFINGTATIADVLRDLADRDQHSFARGDELVGFLRKRGFIAPDAPDLSGLDRLAVEEETLLQGRIALGPLLDLVATFLDKLDQSFDLYAHAPVPDTVPNTLEPAALEGRAQDNDAATAEVALAEAETEAEAKAETKTSQAAQPSKGPPPLAKAAADDARKADEPVAAAP